MKRTVILSVVGAAAAATLFWALWETGSLPGLGPEGSPPSQVSAQAANPCNPNAARAANPCNPCGGGGGGAPWERTGPRLGWGTDYRTYPRAAGPEPSGPHGNRTVVTYVAPREAAQVYAHNARLVRQNRTGGFRPYPVGTVLVLESFNRAAAPAMAGAAGPGQPAGGGAATGAAGNPCAAPQAPAKPGNPCAAAAKAANPCVAPANPCAAAGASNPCNPCAAKTANPCAAPARPANPCAAATRANPCNPCAAPGKAANPCAAANRLTAAFSPRRPAASLPGRADLAPGPVFLMKKEPPGYDGRGGDWRYAATDPALRVSIGEGRDGPVGFCKECHATAQTRDFVFAGGGS